MKKTISLILVLSMSLCALLMTSCAKTETETEENKTPTVEEMVDQIPDELLFENYEDTDGINPGAPGSSTPYTRTELKLDGDPVWKDGKLELRFTENVTFDERFGAYIGLYKSYEASTVSADWDYDAMSSMLVNTETEEDGDEIKYYSGIVIVPTETIEPGEYSFFVSFDMYTVETFTLEIN